MDKYYDDLLGLLDIALGYAKDRAFYTALEHVQAAQREYLIAEAESNRIKSRTIIMAIAKIDITSKKFELEYRRIEKDLSPEARNLLSDVLDNLHVQRQELIQKKKVLGTACSPLPPSKDVERGIELEAGDILAVSRKAGLYQHFAVYIGSHRVIHYAAEHGDFSGRITIHEAPFEVFRGDSTFVYVLDFPDKSGQPTRRGFSSKTLEHEESPFFDLIREADYHLYSPEETVARAKSRLGEEKYSLPVNNCEHFAIWCKTGIHESHQVNMWISRLSSIAHRYL